MLPQHSMMQSTAIILWRCESRCQLAIARDSHSHQYLAQTDLAQWRQSIVMGALWHVDHGRSLAIIQPFLLRNQIEHKRAK